MKGMSTEMAQKIKLKNRKIQTIEVVFALFVISRTADGVSETTTNGIGSANSNPSYSVKKQILFGYLLFYCCLVGFELD